MIKRYLVKFTNELFGFALVALGTVLMLYSDLGLNPWGILHQGIAIQTGLTFGQASQLLGLSVMVVCLFFKVIPGVGTVLNMYFVGKFIDIISGSPFFFTPDAILAKLAMLFIGLILLALGMFFYLRENLGAGPKDGLMLLINKRADIDIGIVRTGMELSAVFLGYMLGGKLGIGTIIVALLLGPILRTIFIVFNYNTKEIIHESIIDTFNNIFR